MKVIGIAGGVASGKSLVTAQLAKLGAAVVDADKIGHEVLREEEVKQAVRQRWGDAVFDDSGEVSRKKIAEIVFAPPPSGPAELEQLEKIVHPKISDRLRLRFDELRSQPGADVAVLDAALMFKTGWDKYCDQILFVDADEQTRRERALSRGWNEETWKARESSQESLDAKRNRADMIIDNSRSQDETFQQVQQYWQDLKAEPATTSQTN